MQELLRLKTGGLAETEAFAARLAHICYAGDCIALSGDLGAGKTAFARAFIRALAGEVEVTSPTFTLVQTYEARHTPLTLWHMDFYRLESAREVEELGLEEALEEHICLIEWPDIAENLLPEARLEIKILPNAAENARVFVVSGNAAWYERLQKECIIPA